MVWLQSPNASTFSFTDELIEAVRGVTEDVSQYAGGRASRNLALSPPAQSSMGSPGPSWRLSKAKALKGPRGEEVSNELLKQECFWHVLGERKWICQHVISSSHICLL